jgi:hypothetical protein
MLLNIIDFDDIGGHIQSIVENSGDCTEKDVLSKGLEYAENASHASQELFKGKLLSALLPNPIYAITVTSQIVMAELILRVPHSN